MLARVIMEAAATALPATMAGVATIVAAADGVTHTTNYPYWPYNYSYWPGSSYGYYTYSYDEGYPYTCSYCGSGYGYNAAMVAQVQRRLGELGYYPGIVDGIMGPQARPRSPLMKAHII
jgi:hypothetical protein